MTSLSPEHITRLLGRVSPAIKQICEDKLTESIELLERNLYLRAGRTFKFKRPTINYELKGKTAGRALHRSDVYTIKLNPAFLLDPNTCEDMLQLTLPHEMAHIAVYQIFPNENDHHGPRWQLMMKYLEIPAERCHSYDTSKAVARKHTKYEVVCTSCGKVMLFGKARVRRLQAGTVYRHNPPCGGLIKERAQ